MECFNHPGKAAVGICKACEKGLCHDCFIDTGHGGACKNHCEEQVRTIGKLIDFNIKNVELIEYNLATTGTKKLNMLSFAALFVILAVFQFIKGNSIAIFVILLAAGFGYYGFQLHRTETRIRAIFQNDKD